MELYEKQKPEPLKGYNDRQYSHNYLRDILFINIENLRDEKDMKHEQNRTV